VAARACFRVSVKLSAAVMSRPMLRCVASVLIAVSTVLAGAPDARAEA